MHTIVEPVAYDDASPEVRAVYDDIMKTRQIAFVPNFWRTIAHDAALLRRTWETLHPSSAEAPGASLFSAAANRGTAGSPPR